MVPFHSRIGAPIQKLLGISEVQGHLWLRLEIMTESQSSYNIFHLNELMKFFKQANHLHLIKNNLKFQIGSVHLLVGKNEVIFHVVGRPNDVPSEFMISGLCVHPIFLSIQIQIRGIVSDFVRALNEATEVKMVWVSGCTNTGPDQVFPLICSLSSLKIYLKNRMGCPHLQCVCSH
jgi:hypothetical protein